MKRQKDRTLKDELSWSVGARYTTGDQWRYNSRKNKGMQPKQKQHPVVDGTDDRSKVQCCKEQYCIGTWNVRSMNQGKFSSVQFSSVAQSCLTLSGPVIATGQASLSITNSRCSIKLTSIESVMPSSHLILCRPLLLRPPIPPSISLFQ